MAFELEKGPYIAVRPICHEGRHSPSAWKMTNAMPSWSWRGFEKRIAHVEVYARAATVELFVNSVSKGKQNFKNNCVFTFKVPYEDGTVEAVSYDEAGRVIGRNLLKTAGAETVLQAEQETETVAPGHLAFIRLKYTDKEGIIKPAERRLIDVKVEGGKLIGLGSACPYYELSYLDSRCDTYYGEALAIVRAGESGEISFTAKDGEHTGKATVAIK